MCFTEVVEIHMGSQSEMAACASRLKYPTEHSPFSSGRSIGSQQASASESGPAVGVLQREGREPSRI